MIALLRHISSPKTRLTVSALLAVATLFIGCGKTVTDFASKSPLGEGIRNKSWRAAVPADEPISDFDPGQDVFARSFDLGVHDRVFTLAASVLELTSGLSVGYVNSYYPISINGQNTDGGWSSYGSASMQAVTFASGEAALAQFAQGPTGTALALFSNDTGSLLAGGFFAGKSWQRFQQNTTGLTSSPVSTNRIYDNHVGLSSAFDRYGRVFVGIPTVDTSGQVTGASVAMNSSIAAATFTTPISLPSGTLTSAELALGFDGYQTLCALYGMSAPDEGLYARCGAITSASPFGASSTEILLHDGIARAIHLASDGIDRMMVVYALSQGNDIYGIYAISATNGVWDSQPTQLDADLPSKGIATLASETLLDIGGSTGVVYLGSGRFLAAWIGVDVDGYTKVFWTLYDSATATWTAPAEVTDSELSPLTPHLELSLFSNQKDNAGIALRTIRSTSGYIATTTQTVFGTQVSRFHVTSGWLPAVTVGNGCAGGTSSPTLQDALPGCKHAPVGAIDSAGNALVVFQDQDENGIYRLMSVEFR